VLDPSPLKRMPSGGELNCHAKQMSTLPVKGDAKQATYLKQQSKSCREYSRPSRVTPHIICSGSSASCRGKFIAKEAT
jgi:hypothetical protein